ncbi:MAG: (2Fe-2S)-binding protein [Leptospiraceae bacterium]
MEEHQARPVCSCFRIGVQEIGDAVSSGATPPSFETVLSRTGAGSQCGACIGDVHAIYLSRILLRRIKERNQIPLPFSELTESP